MSDPRLTAAQLNEYLAGFLALRDAGIEIDDAGQEMESMVRELIALRADVERLTAERDALQQRILGMEDRLDIVTAEDAMKKIAQGGTLHNADGSQRWCWCSTLQAVGSASAKCPPCLARDIERLTAEHAALREERDEVARDAGLYRGTLAVSALLLKCDEHMVDAEVRRLIAERDALREELAKWKICENCGEPLAGPGICDKAISDKEKGLEQMWEDTLTRAEKAERELAEARAEMAKLKDEKQFLFSELRNRPPSQFGIIGGPDAPKCPPSLMEEWRGANEDGRKR